MSISTPFLKKIDAFVSMTKAERTKKERKKTNKIHDITRMNVLKKTNPKQNY